MHDKYKLITKLKDKKIHYFDESIMVYTDNLSVYLKIQSEPAQKIKIKRKWWHFLAANRIIARLLRSDQFNIITIVNKNIIYVLRHGSVYHIRLDKFFDVKFIAKIPFRGIIHNAHCILPSGEILFGCYHNGKKQRHLRLYIIDTTAHVMRESACLDSLNAKHIHAIRWDEITKTIWICTGDDDGECHIVLMNVNYEIINILGDGGQIYRTCDFIFLPDSVIWAMDSPLEKSHIIKYDRKTNNITVLQDLEGPGWYVAKASGCYFLSVVSEPGPNKIIEGPRILKSYDGEEWEIFKKYKKDFWPSICKFGTCEIGSSDGVHLYVNHQATVNHDGNAYVYGPANIADSE